MAGEALTSTIQIFVDDQKLLLKADPTVSDDFEREGVAGLDGVHGFNEKQMVPMIKATVTWKEPVTFAMLKAITNATIQLDRPGKPTIILHEAWYKGGTEVNLANAEAQVEFHGHRMEEV